jgi:hypothetical protein
MPALPWTSGLYNPTGDRELHVLTSTLPLTRYRDVPRFLRWTMRLRKQLASTDGCAGYSLDARLLRKTFYTPVGLAGPRCHEPLRALRAARGNACRYGRTARPFHLR